MTETKDYRGPDGKAAPGVWKRVYVNPQASFDTKIDPYSAKDFVKVTANKKGGTVGELWDRAADLSASRADKDGKDPIKAKYYEKFSKKRRGKMHPQQRREEANEKLKKVGITVNSWGDE